jgi:hypothetical protein
MSSPLPGGRPGCGGMTRRGFLVGAGAGLAVGAPLGIFGLRSWQSRNQRREESSFSGRSVEDRRAEFAMPGPYPGRVIEVHHPGSVNADHQINENAVRTMMDRGMCALTGADGAPDAWRRLFERDDVVGIKVNPVGRKPSSGDARRTSGVVGSISSPEVLLEIVRSLKDIGIPARNLIVFERYANEFRDAGYDEVMDTRPMQGVRWYACGSGYDDQQLEIDGQSPRGGRDPHVVGYDPDVFVSMGFCAQNHDPRDDRRFRSHLSVIVTRMVNKFITIPCLKDHRSAGVTIALKNISHGMNNNVARSHISGIYRMDGSMSGPNQCNTFIPTAVAQRPIREKATLHIMDGLIGVYEGGPGCWNRTWATWQRKSLFFATDPVAMDHVGWDIIDAKRAAEGWQPVANMGLLHHSPTLGLSARLSALAAFTPVPTAALAAMEHHQRLQGRNSESFDRRQPEHVILAGMLGLGNFNATEIDYRRIEVLG